MKTPTRRIAVHVGRSATTGLYALSVAFKLSCKGEVHVERYWIASPSPARGSH